MYGLVYVVGLFGGIAILGQIVIVFAKSEGKTKSRPKVIK